MPIPKVKNYNSWIISHKKFSIPKFKTTAMWGKFVFGLPIKYSCFQTHVLLASYTFFYISVLDLFFNLNYRWYT